jgi:hypothetical protein
MENQLALMVEFGMIFLHFLDDIFEAIPGR